MLERNADRELSLSLQSDLLGLSRTSLYYEPRSAGEREVLVKRRLDELYTEHPFLGSRKVEVILEKEGFVVGRHTIRRYQREMGIQTLYPKPNLSQTAQGQDHKVFPYLLRGLLIERSNQVWGVDITYVRLTAGWAGETRFAIVSRRVSGLAFTFCRGLGIVRHFGNGIRFDVQSDGFGKSRA